MCGVRESSIDPGKELAVKWGDAAFTGMSFAEHFTVLAGKVRVVATYADGTSAAFENTYGKGYVMLLGTFAGQQNDAKPVGMHPLGGILAKWAGLTQAELNAPPLVELREMESPAGKLVIFFNHGEKDAEVDFSGELERSAASVREIMTGEAGKAEGKRFAVKAEMPPQTVRIYRIDY